MVSAVLLCCAVMLWTFSPRRMRIFRWLQKLNRQETSSTRQFENREQTGELCRIADPALLLDLFAVCIEAGAPVSQAMETVSKIADTPLKNALIALSGALELGATWDEATEALRERSASVEQLVRVLRFAVEASSPSADIIRSQVDDLRKTRRAVLRKACAELGIRLVLPLGVCSLPAFVSLGIVPVVLALFAQFDL